MLNSKKRSSTRELFFRKIETREHALQVINNGGRTFVFMGCLQLAFSYYVPGILFDAIILLTLSLILIFLKSRIAAVLLTIFSGLNVIVTFLNIIGITNAGGRNLFTAILLFWIAIKTIEATITFYKQKVEAATPISDGNLYYANDPIIFSEMTPMPPPTQKTNNSLAITPLELLLVLVLFFTILFILFMLLLMFAV